MRSYNIKVYKTILDAELTGVQANSKKKAEEAINELNPALYDQINDDLAHANEDVSYEVVVEEAY